MAASACGKSRFLPAPCCVPVCCSTCVNVTYVVVDEPYIDEDIVYTLPLNALDPVSVTVTSDTCLRATLTGDVQVTMPVSTSEQSETLLAAIYIRHDGEVLALDEDAYNPTVTLRVPASATLSPNVSLTTQFVTRLKASRTPYLVYVMLKHRDPLVAPVAGLSITFFGALTVKTTS